jgi:hypothetical protein
MKALVINCTLKKSPEPSNTHALAEISSVSTSGGTAWRSSTSGPST